MTMEEMAEANDSKRRKLKTANEVYGWYERYVLSPDKAKEPKMPFGTWLLHVMAKLGLGEQKMLTTKRMAEAMYAMDILAAKLRGGTRLGDWYKETGLMGPRHFASPTDAQTVLYEGWLMASPDANEAFNNLVSSFVFMLAREAFGQCKALDELVCKEGVFA